MWDIISRNAGSRNRAVVGRPRSARCTGLGLQVGLPLKAGMDAAAGNQAVLAAFSLKALAVAEPSEKFQQGSTGARAADSPIFAPRHPHAKLGPRSPLGTQQSKKLNMKYQFLIDTYETERLKVLSVWSMFRDGDLPRRPHATDPRGRSVHEHFVHQCVSENLWFLDILGIDVGVPPLPADETPSRFSSTATPKIPANAWKHSGRNPIRGGKRK